ncbi:MAG: hypothetical protein ACJ8AO_11155, partial [Gemmatimonadaceae bacterium]
MHRPRLAPPARMSALAVLLAVLPAVWPSAAAGQDADPQPGKADSAKFPNTTAGEFTPGTGFTIVQTARGSLNVSVYGLFRYLNQSPANQTFVDHLGRERAVNDRN